MIALALFVRAREFLVRLFKLRKLHLASVMLTWCISVARVVLRALPCEGFFWSTVLLILTAVSRVMGVLCAPMLIA